MYFTRRSHHTLCDAMRTYVGVGVCCSACVRLCLSTILLVCMGARSFACVCVCVCDLYWNCVLCVGRTENEWWHVWLRKLVLKAARLLIMNETTFLRSCAVLIMLCYSLSLSAVHVSVSRLFSLVSNLVVNVQKAIQLSTSCGNGRRFCYTTIFSFGFLVLC